MPKNSTVGRYSVYPAVGGLETVSIPGAQTQGRLTSGSNFIIDLSGAKRKHPGIARRQDNGSTVITTGNTRGLFDLWRTSGSVKVQSTLVVTGGKVYADSGDGIYADKTGAFVIASTDNVYMDAFSGLLIIGFDVNPGTGPLKYNGTTLAALGGTPPNFKYPRVWQGRLWGAGRSTNPDVLYASVIDNPEDWTLASGAQSINIDIGDQDPIGITALFPGLFGRMVVAKRRSLYEITPVSSTFAVNQLVAGIGCVSHNAVAAADNDIYFVSERGVHSLLMTDKFGQLETAFLSYPIQNFFQDYIDFRRAGNMRAIYVPEINCYLLAATLKGSYRNDIVLGYNFVHKEWFRFDENVSAMSKYVDPQDGYKTKVLVANDAGQIGILDTQGIDRTVTWFDERRTTQFTTGLIFPINVATEVNLSKLTCFYRPQVAGSEFTVSYYADGKFIEDLTFPMDPASGSIIGQAIIGAGALIGGRGVIKQATRQMRGVCHSTELVFTHIPQSDEDDFELYGYTVEFEYAGESEKTKTQ